jgi:2-iminobutanoate/2-iminopropanoate deaminase
LLGSHASAYTCFSAKQSGREERGMATRCGQRVEMRVPGLPEPLSHYTDAVRFGDILFVSGLTPLDENGRLLGEGDVVAQARQIHVNLERVLTHAGASFADVLKVTVFLVSIGDRAKINDVRRDYFGSAFPASTLVEVSALAVPGMLVEIEAIVGMPAR